MKSAVALVWFVLILPFLPTDADAQETPAEHYRSLSAEYESALRTSLGRPRADGAKARNAPNELPPDLRVYATRFLKLANDYPDDPSALDSLDWILRHVRTGLERDGALRLLGERYIQSDRLGDFCSLLIGPALQGTSEPLLVRIMEESTHPAVREEACLCLALSESRLANEARRLSAYKPEQRERWIRALGQARVGELLSLDPASLDQKADRQLQRLLDEDAKILRSEKIGGAYLSLLNINPSPAADSIVRVILETNPHREIKDEARWALAIRLMESARLTAMIKSASLEARRLLVQDWGQGRVAKLEAIDPSIRAKELEDLLQRISDENASKALPRFATELMSSFARLPTGAREAAYHKNAERLLRRIAETNPDRSSRGRASYSLARYQIGLANEVARLKLSPDASLAYLVSRLGRERAEQLKGLDPLLLNGDAERLLEQAVRDYADVTAPWAAGPLGEQAKSALLELRRAAIGRVAPEIVGDDVEGKPMKLSDYRGKVVLLNFGCHETCSPCRAMYPYEKSLVRRLREKPFVLLGFDVDADRAKLEQTMKSEQMTWRSWWANGDGAIARRWVVGGLPTLYLIDPKGVIRARYDGFPGEATLDRAVMTLLNEHSATGGS
jgi:thiol-disulfide isomerase/thioredoxin